MSTERLSLTPQGHVRYRLKTPCRDGTTDGVFEPLDNIAGTDFEQPQAGPQDEGPGCPAYFSARLAARVPTPRVNLTRYHGVFAPNHRRREHVTPARRGRRPAATTDEPAPARHVSMSLKRNG